MTSIPDRSYAVWNEADIFFFFVQTLLSSLAVVSGSLFDESWKDVLAGKEGEPEFTGNPWALGDWLVGEESREPLPRVE